MDTQFADIKILIWDLDGTLYQSIPALSAEILEADYQVVMRHTGWSREKTIEEFHKVFKVKTPSSTLAAAIVAGIPLIDVAIECEQYKDRTKHLVRDEKLVAMFEKLSGFTHYMLVNGIQEKTREALKVLGLSADVLAEIVTSEIVGENKPSEKGFRYILDKTKLPPDQHLMIGDREAIDLVPAKKIGMKTCLVWADPKGQFSSADIVLPTVYDISNFLI